MPAGDSRKISNGFLIGHSNRPGGRGTTPAEIGTFTDISTIPFSAIERVEPTTDGGSASYGSDAVGRVANFILKRDCRVPRCRVLVALRVQQIGRR